VNSTNGLTHELGRSERAGGQTNFVVGAASGPAATLYPGALRSPGTPSTLARFAVADAAGRQNASGVGTWAGVNLPSGMAAQVFEAHLTAGIGTSITLTRFMGVSDLEVRVYPPDITVASAEQALATSTPRDGDDEYDDLFLSPGATGTYLIVVARVDQSHLDEACGYQLDLASTGTVGAPQAFAAAPLTAAPTPASGPMRLSFTLAAPSHATLALYDVGGRLVKQLVDGALPAGPFACTWSGEGVAPGRYFARLSAGSRHETLGVLRVR